MKTLNIFTLICLFLLQAGFSQDKPGMLSIHLKNNSDLNRENEVVELSLDVLEKLNSGFNTENFSITENGNPVNFEIIFDETENQEKIFLLLSFRPNEIKKVNFVSSPVSAGEKLTQAYLGEKKNYTMEDGYYKGGNFESISLARVPVDHFAHNALYQYEGPGWESEKVGYRLYLDDRNRTDIFGKKEPGMITHLIGKNDLVSDGKESYQQMQDWGQDIFKVGSSLGIGSVAAYSDSVITVSKYDSVTCKIFDKRLVSAVKTIHYGWSLPDKKINLETLYSIKAGSRLTKVNVKPEGNIENFCTGIAKHSGTEFFTSDNKTGWNYIALWGKQTTANDNLGIAVFYSVSDKIKISEDALSHFVILKPSGKNIEYYFAAAWEQEKNGITGKDDFRKYLDAEVKKLNEPVQIFKTSD